MTTTMTRPVEFNGGRSMQTPQYQTGLDRKMKTKEESFWPGGSFACPADSHYGVCYTMSNCGTLLSFNISGWKTDDKTVRPFSAV